MRIDLGTPGKGESAKCAIQRVAAIPLFPTNLPIPHCPEFCIGNYDLRILDSSYGYRVQYAGTNSNQWARCCNVEAALMRDGRLLGWSWVRPPALPLLPFVRQHWAVLVAALGMSR